MSAKKQQSSLLSFFQRKGGGDTPSTSAPTTPKTPKSVPRTVPKTETPAVLKRVNPTDDDSSPIKSQRKRRRVILDSDDEEEENAITSAVDEGQSIPASKEPATPFKEFVYSTPTGKSTPKTSHKTPKFVATPKTRTKKEADEDFEMDADEDAVPKRRKERDLSHHISVDMGDSFIRSFRFDEGNKDEEPANLDDSALTTATLDKTVYKVDVDAFDEEGMIDFGNDKSDESDVFVHDSFQFLQPDRIMDAQKRKPDHPDYDPTTLFVPKDFLDKQSPGHQQWWKIKSQFYDTILLFKVGKFYELYHMDAAISVPVLSLSFMKGSYAHTGFPEAAYGKFSDQLISRGYKVSRIEQTETPEQLEQRNTTLTKKEKVVKREVCRLTTQATRTYGVYEKKGEGDDIIDSGTKYLLAIREKADDHKSSYGVCFVDTSVGGFFVGQFEDDDYRSHLRTLLASFPPTQVLVEKSALSKYTRNVLDSMLSSVPIEGVPSKSFSNISDTLTALCREEYFGELAKWPEVLRELTDKNSTVVKADPNAELLWSAVSAVFCYLGKCLIDVDMISMKNFEKYEPLSSGGLRNLTKTEESEGSSRWAKRNMVLDGVTLENLNLIAPLGADKSLLSTSLFHIIDRTKTSMGKRHLHRWICAPSCDAETLRTRQAAVEWLAASEKSSMKDARKLISSVPDLERSLQKLHTLGLKYRVDQHPDSRAVMFESVKYNKRKITDLMEILSGFDHCMKLFENFRVNTEHDDIRVPILDELFHFNDLDLIRKELAVFKKKFKAKEAMEEGIIVPEPGTDREYDATVREIKFAKDELEKYRAQLSKEFGYKVNYVGSGRNRYTLEMPDACNPKVRDLLHFEVRGMRKGYTRYISTDLIDLMRELTEAEAKHAIAAADACRRVFAHFDENKELWSKVVGDVGELDVLLSLAAYANSSGLQMVMPVFDFEAEEPYLNVESGVHPCLATKPETMFAVEDAPSTYIANSSNLGFDGKPRVVLLTGPNMGGKSTLMRQVAVLSVLAHMGSFVPAASMRLTPVDRIFTRIGANDRMLCGQSTFYVELNETKIVLRDATKHSLVLMDELGRGTSTYDGTAIALAVLCQLSDELRCRCYFSTHYHTLCSRTADNPRIGRAHMACMVEGENVEHPTDECVTFLYRLVDGDCPKSFGFYAAKLAGISEEIVRKSYEASGRLSHNRDAILALKKAVEEKKSIEELTKMVEAM